MFVVPPKPDTGSDNGDSSNDGSEGGGPSCSAAGKDDGPSQDADQPHDANIIDAAVDLDDIIRHFDDAVEYIDNIHTLSELGKKGEAVVKEKLQEEGMHIAGEQVAVRTKDGELRIIDFIVTENGQDFAAVEVKVNTARRSRSQRRKDESISTYGATILSKTRPLFFGLTYGTEITLHTTVLQVTITTK